jgi:iron complex outermembrane receptor protein
LLRADSLSGKVVDTQGLAVPNATIRLLDRHGGEQRNTTSGADGSYAFADIPSGLYVIEADAALSALIGAQEISISGNQTLDLEVRIAATQSEVLVTASSTPQTIAEVAKAIDVVSAERMNRRGVFQISEAVRVLPGVQVQTLEGPGSFTTIKTRGLRSFDTAILVDGLRFQDAASPQNDASAFLQDLIATDTERIEFLRGSASSLYGSNAMAGVINIVSRNGGGPPHGELRTEGGGLGLFRGVAGIGGSADGDRFTYSGGVAYANVADGVRDRSPYRSTSGQASVRYAVQPQLMLMARVWGNGAKSTSTETPTFTEAILANSAPGTVHATPLPDDQLELFENGQPFNAGSATYIPNQIDPDGNRLSSFFTGTGALQHAVSDRSSYRIAYQGVDTRRGYRDGPAGPGAFDPPSEGTDHFNGRTDTIQARLDQRLGALNFLTVGYELVREKYFSYSDTPADETRNNAITLAQRSHSVYAQDQIQLIDGRLQLALSGRVQFFDLEEPVFSGEPGNPYAGNIGSIDTPNASTGDASAAYLLQNARTKLRVHVGNSYRAPSSFERLGGGFGSYYGDPRLEPERATSIDAGVDRWLMSSKVQVSATVFWTKLQEAIRFANVLPADDPFGRESGGYENGGGGRARGVELSTHLSPGRRTQAQVSYTYANSESETPTFGTDYFKTLGLSPHVFALSLTQRISRGFQATFDLFTKSRYDLTLSGARGRLFDFDGTTRANLMLSYGIPVGERRDLEIYTRIDNMFDERPHENGFIGPSLWAVAGLRLKY